MGSVDKAKPSVRVGRGARNLLEEGILRRPYYGIKADGRVAEKVSRSPLTRMERIVKLNKLVGIAALLFFVCIASNTLTAQKKGLYLDYTVAIEGPSSHILMVKLVVENIADSELKDVLDELRGLLAEKYLR